MKNTIKTLKRITASFLRFISFGNIDLDRARHQPWGRDIDPARAGANASRAIEKIKGATHPDFRDKDGRSQHLHRGDFRIGNQWVKDAGLGPDIGYGGWYNEHNRECWTVCNPANPADYSDRTQRHETAHDIESRHQLNLRDRWHNPAWQHLFANWRKTAAALVAQQRIYSSAHAVAAQTLMLPHVRHGDQITIDLIIRDQPDGGNLSIACRAGHPKTIMIS